MYIYIYIYMTVVITIAIAMIIVITIACWRLLAGAQTERARRHSTHLTTQPTSLPGTGPLTKCRGPPTAKAI